MKDYEPNLFSEVYPDVVCDKSYEYTLTAKKNEFDAIKIRNSGEAEKYARQFYGEDIAIYESAFIILLNRALNTIGWVKISQGGLSATVVDLKLVAKYAIESLASVVIFVHNHPSGSLISSAQDDQLTRRLKEGLKTLDVVLQDSIILAPESGFYSYADNGRL